MNPVRGRQLVFEQKTGSFDICENHALFDQLVCVITFLGNQAGNRASLIKLESILSTFKPDCPAFETRCEESLVKRMQIIKIAFHIIHVVMMFQHTAFIIVGDLLIG